jgi:hypothetical protein
MAVLAIFQWAQCSDLKNSSSFYINDLYYWNVNLQFIVLIKETMYDQYK